MAVGDVSRLPRWGQRLIAEAQAEAERARGDLADYVARETATLEASTVIADPYGGCPRPLGDGTRVHFANGEVTFAVEFDSASGVLDVTVTGRRASADRLAVYPYSGNAVRMKGGAL